MDCNRCSVGCRGRSERCRAGRHHVAGSTSSPFTGSRSGSGCLAAARRQTDSVDSVLLPALDVLAGHDPDLSATNHGLRPASGYLDDTSTDMDDVGVFYTTNSQHPAVCGPNVSDLLLSTTSCGARDHRHDVSKSTYDLQTIELHQPASCADDDQQLTASTSAGDAERAQPNLLVDFHR